MRRIVLLVGAVFAALAVSGAAGSSGSVQARWVIRDLGTFSAGRINERGQVVGERGGHAFLWEKGRMLDLGTLPGDKYSGAYLINDRGQIVGVSTDKNKIVRRGFLWEKGVMRNLGRRVPQAINARGQVILNRDGPGVLHAFVWEKGKLRELRSPEAFMTRAWAINDRGQIVVSTRDARGDHGLVWQNGTMRDLGKLPGGKYITPLAINNKGQIVGSCTVSEDKDKDGARDHHAFLWEKGKMRDLGTLGARPLSEAVAINESGQIIGYSEFPPAGHSDPVPALPAHAFLWQNGKMRDLGTLGGRYSWASAINERGQIVGSANTKARLYGQELSHAFVYENGKMTDLGTLRGDATSSAAALNDQGQIIGWSSTESGERHAVLWTLRSG